MPALEARAAGALAVSSARAVFTDRMAGGPFTCHALPSSLAPALSGTRAPAVARAVGRAERRLALRAAPAVEALALARRHARAVARAPALALRLGAVVTAPSVRARALARRRAVATSNTRTSTFFDLNLRTRFRNRQISATYPLRQNTWRYHPVGQKSSGPYSLHCRMSIQQTTVLVSCGFDGGSSPGVNSRPLPAVA